MFWDWPEETIRGTSGVYITSGGEQELSQYEEDYCQK